MSSRDGRGKEVELFPPPRALIGEVGEGLTLETEGTHRRGKEVS
jgi:hypothetical protein